MSVGYEESYCRYIRLTWQKVDDLLHILFKANLQDSVSLIDHQTLQVFVEKVWSVLEVVQQAAWSCHYDIDTYTTVKGFPLLRPLIELIKRFIEFICPSNKFIYRPLGIRNSKTIVKFKY